ncbi:CPBP family intramembrane metalloprotease [Frankia sp. CNm7]|uniref:CPBP family intramembrane metalloprotease n=1 Tax=Frankia nepalensis TaxID=1836974 RepID=A0A937UN36_9ACTN|nr:CPBP family intramembrane glutamic endopeptidase [Frankia nepalensis]MBL7500338.1 CPBP family intramembrane metalloprotease [Frankia nepalensis]MBL7508560.1 CPBP family intramembrane metalloprotease [Frankia nepalensis]MBL7524217.1 CPBP family intramembrane metalloprotease [Frankia nepalensis]MBL7627688.1 CPBP family intramembrane metalloprotease [Frankia nepalensis]
MGRLLFVAALAPVFATVLALVVSMSIARGRASGRATVTAVAPLLYGGTAVGFAVVAGATVGFDPEQLGLWPAHRPVLLVVALGVAGVLAGVLGYLGELALADRAAPAGARGTPVGTRAVRGWATSPWALVALGITTAVAEELLFRGFLLTGLRRDLPLAAAVVVQAALFGLHHGSFGWRAMPIKAVHALVWAGLAVGAGSLVPALVAHLVFQLLVCRRLVSRGSTTSAVRGGRDDRARSAAAV